MISSLLDSFLSLNHWQVDALVIFFLLQGALCAVFPEEIIITALGILWGQGRVHFIETLLAVQMGLLPANFTLVYIGKRFGSALLSKRPFSYLFQMDSIAKSLETLSRYGVPTVALTRFTPLIRGPMYFAIGLSKIRLKKFFIIDAMASFLQIPALLWLGAKLGKESHSILEAYQRLGKGMAVMLIGSLVFLMIRKQRRRPLPTT